MIRFCKNYSIYCENVLLSIQKVKHCKYTKTGSLQSSVDLSVVFIWKSAVSVSSATLTPIIVFKWKNGLTKSVIHCMLDQNLTTYQRIYWKKNWILNKQERQLLIYLQQCSISFTNSYHCFFLFLLDHLLVA